MRATPRRHAPLSAAALSLGMVLLGQGCGSDVKYPQCETDEQCKQDASGNAINEYCVNKQCQQCREDAHCEAGQVCANGRCQQASECPCEAPLVCQNDKCVQPECVTNEDCEAGKICDANVCVDAPCTTDQECGAGMVCNDGVCEATSDQISSECRPMSPEAGEVVALQVVSFEFDKAELTPSSRQALEHNAECLRQAPDLVVVLEGHCDERGTQEYNLALGDRRAHTVKEYLENLGVEASRLRTVSKGKNEPICTQSSESCYAKNRRVQFVQRR